jgi:polyisoprenoid-binding protein YceI
VIVPLLLAAIVSQPTAFRVDPAGAVAGFDLKATMHTVHGTTTKLSGEVRVVPADGDALTLSGRIEVDAASLDTGNAKRDAKLHGDTLEAATNPAIVLVPERFAPSAPPAADGTTLGQLTGQLTIRGKTHPATIAASLAPNGNRVVVNGTFDVTWADYGIPDPSFFVVRIEKVAHAHFRAEFSPLP